MVCTQVSSCRYFLGKMTVRPFLYLKLSWVGSHFICTPVCDSNSACKTSVILMGFNLHLNIACLFVFTRDLLLIEFLNGVPAGRIASY